MDTRPLMGCSGKLNLEEFDGLPWSLIFKESRKYKIKKSGERSKPYFWFKQVNSYSQIAQVGLFCVNLCSPNYETHALILEILSTFIMLPIKGHYFHQLLFTGCLAFCYTYCVDPQQHYKNKNQSKKACCRVIQGNLDRICVFAESPGVMEFGDFPFQVRQD